ncbi:MAG: hypothetical protein IT442_00480 [Phycisphaeraceae bacterium]|nr:hypothetical protein [Phycisphaeraceae bacterium]
MAMLAAWPCLATTPEEIEDQVPVLRGQFSDPNLDPVARVASLRQAMDDLRGLIDHDPTSPRQSKWRTDLAEMLLFDWIGGVNQRADLCAEFGWLEPEQAEALWPAVNEAARNLVAAREKSADAKDNVALQLLWSRVVYLSALAPDGHALIGGARGEEAAAARKKRLEHALAIAAGLAGREDVAPGVRAEAASLAARAAMRLGDTAQAKVLLDQAEAIESPPPLSARLARACWLASQDRLDDALALLRSERRQAAKDKDTGLALLSTDAAWRLLESTSDSSAQPKPVTARSAAPYQELLNDEDWPLNTRQGLRAVLGGRWRRAYGDMPAEQDGDLGALVRSCVGEAMLNEARAQRKTDPTNAVAGFTHAEAWLRAALRDKDTGLAGQESDAARWNLGWAIYERMLCMPAPDAPGQAATLREAAAKVWLDLAESRPDARHAEEAIGNAVKLLRGTHDGEQTYRAAAETLFARFPASSAADDERFYFAQHVLEPAGQWRKAIELYEHVPINHPDYWPAQAARLEALRELAGKDESVWPSLEKQAGEIEQAAAKAMRVWNAPPQARAAWNRAKIERARAVLELGRPGEVESILTGTDPAPIAQTLRVRALLAMGHDVDAIAAARRGVDEFADQGWDAAKQALTTLADQLDSAPASVRQPMGKLAETVLSQPWSEQLTPADHLLLAETAAEACWRGGDLAGAVQHLSSLDLDPHGLYILIEATYQLGNDEALGRTVQAGAQLIQATAPGQPMWWHGWMRLLQARDKLGQGQDIFLAVRQLQLRDANLGGGPCRDELLRLMRKYQPAGTSTDAGAAESAPAR